MKHVNKLHLLFSNGTEHTFSAKESIVYASSETEPTMFWISKGYVKVVSYSRTGSERIHYIYGPGDIFPLGWLLSGTPRWVSFVALSKVSVVHKSYKSFIELMAKEPFILQEVTSLQLNAHDRIYNLGLDDAESRMGHFLLMLAMRFGIKTENYVNLTIPLSRQEFADATRMSRETAGQVLNKLESKNFIILGKKRLLIYVQKLTDLVEKS